MSGPYSHSGREDALFFQLLLDLRQILFDKHKAQAHQQQCAGKPDRPFAEDADALCADARTQRKDKDNGKVVQGLPQRVFIVAVSECDQRVHAAAQVADAHGTGKRVAMHLAERLHLHGAGKRDQRVCANIPPGREEAHREQQHDLGQNDELAPVHLFHALIAAVDAFRHKNARRERDHRHKIAENICPVACKKVCAHQHDVARLRVGKHLVAAAIGIGVLQSAG